MQDHHAPPWLIGGHAETIWPALLLKGRLGPLPSYRRERWNAPDGDFIDVDFVDLDADAGADAGAPSTVLVRRTDAGLDRTGGVGAGDRPLPPPQLAAASEPPLLVLFHGLEGSSTSHYSIAFAHEARRRGWRYAVAHFRGCSGEINRAPRAYHSGDFEEIGWVLARLRAAHRGRLVAVGVSLGGNALMRWAAEAGDTAGATVDAVAAVSSPLDLAAGGQAIGTGFNRQVYTRMFLRTMKPKALAKAAQFPGLIDLGRLAAARTLHAFDDVFTAPLHGFRDADDYWRRASAKPLLRRVGVPALLLNARNDPFVPAASLPLAGEVSPSVTLWQPAHGGHVGFTAGRFPGHLRTLPEAVVDWLAASWR